MATYKNPIPSVEEEPLVEEPLAEEEPVNLEIEENDYTEKESVYFAFIDVLGFRKAFDDNRQNDGHYKDNEFAKKFKDVFTYYFDLMGSANFMAIAIDKNLCYAGQTSDSLYFYTEKAELLVEFLKIFSHLNVYAMTQDVFFRGGIAKGSLFYKQNYQFYGDCVINAYLLESEVSKYPRIVIDESTYNDIKSISENGKLVDHNDRCHLRPFAYLENEIALDVNQSIEIREIDKSQLSNMIKQNKSKFEYDTKNYDKYVFLLDKLVNIKDKIGIE